MADWRNQLYFGDNLDMLRKHIPSESVDLIYLDPPFNSKASYNVLFGEKSGERSAAQITAFEDTWHWGLESEQTYHEVVTSQAGGPKRLGDLLQALRTFLGQNDMMAYLVMMAIRLVELHRVLKPTGSIYLHCDPTASHYIKMLLDAVFGAHLFVNEIAWRRSHTRSSISRRFRRNHDILLFYAKSDAHVFNMQHGQLSEASLRIYCQEDRRGRYRLVPLLVSGRRKGETGKTWRGIDPNSRGKDGMHWITVPAKLEEYDRSGLVVWPTREGGAPNLKYYLEDSPGVPLGDFWYDVNIIESSSPEALGYPTQKPEALLERIIKASSNEGDLVLDPFCGCGTTVAVAERLRRRWIGMDITYLAVNLMKRRLADTFKSELSPYRVIGDPKDLASAEALATENRHQFEWWAVDLVGARPAQDKKKGADTGIDGYLNFFDDDSGQAKTVIVQVKSGHVTVSQIRDLKGVIEREKATMGAFLTLSTPTNPMIQEAVAAGFYESKEWPGRRFPRLQILTIGELLLGKMLDYPSWGAPATYKQAVRKGKGGVEQRRLSGV